MLSRKHIRAPRSFDPGPGLPRERLAYLSEAEMEALRLATDGTVNRGPRGIPSFAVTSGTTSGTSMGGGEKTKDNPSGGGPGGPFGANSGPSTSSATKSASGSGGQGSGGSHPASGASPGSTASKSSASASSAPAASKEPSSSTPSRSPSTASSAAPASPMGGQGTSFSSSAAASAANKAASLRSGAPTVSPMGGQGTSFSKPAAAEAANKATASATKGGLNPSGSSKTASAMATANTGSYPGQGVTAAAPNGDMMAPNAGTDFSRALRSLGQDLGQPNPNFDNSPQRFGNWASDSFGRIAGVSPEAAREMTKTIVGEAAGEGLMGQAAVAKVMENRLNFGRAYPGQTGYLGAGDEMAMLKGFDANGYRKSSTRNSGYSKSAPGTAAYSRASAAMADSLDPYGDLATQHPDVLNATHYLTSDLAGTKSWTKNDAWRNSAAQIGNHVFGNAEDSVDKVAAANQSRMPGAAARTQAYSAANPPSQQGALQLASYGGPVRTPAADTTPSYQLSGGGIYNALKNAPGAISGLLGSLNTAPLKQALSDPNIKRFAGMVTSPNGIVRSAANAVGSQVIGKPVGEAIRGAISGLKDTFDPNNPRAVQTANYSVSTPSRAPTAGSARNDQTSEQRGASATKGGAKDGGREMIQPKRATVATSKGRVGRKRIEDLATPYATAPNPWDYFTNVITKEQALRQLLGEDWYKA